MPVSAIIFWAIIAAMALPLVSWWWRGVHLKSKEAQARELDEQRAARTERGAWLSDIPIPGDAGLRRVSQRRTSGLAKLGSKDAQGVLMQFAGWHARQMVDRCGARAASERASETQDKFSPCEGM